MSKRFNPFKKDFCFNCPACKDELVVHLPMPPSGAFDCYVGIARCEACNERLFLNYEMASNVVKATVKETPNER